MEVYNVVQADDHVREPSARQQDAVHRDADGAVRSPSEGEGRSQFRRGVQRHLSQISDDYVKNAVRLLLDSFLWQLTQVQKVLKSAQVPALKSISPIWKQVKKQLEMTTDIRLVGVEDVMQKSALNERQHNKTWLQWARKQFHFSLTNGFSFQIRGQCSYTWLY